MFCTILATNYLPKALALAESLGHHHPGARLQVLLIDCESEADLPALPDWLEGVAQLRPTSSLGLSRAELHRLTTIYELVEFATAVKPLLLERLLEDDETAVYLDPDTWVTAPLEDIAPALAASEGGVLLTPHFLQATPTPGDEGHLLTVGVFNLGFCAVDRRAGDFLRWWWGHLSEECLADYSSGLFVDQKWVDVGAPLFGAAVFRHPGYNVGVVNYGERPVEVDGDGYRMQRTGQPLRLFHFHAFDPDRPDRLSGRGGHENHGHESSPAVRRLCTTYAERVRAARDALPPAPAYPYVRDRRGRRLNRHVRRAYRTSAGDLPSPFVDADAQRWEQWRHSVRRTVLANLAGDVAKSFRLAFPEEYGRMANRFPRVTGALKGRLGRGSGMWR